MVRATKMAGMGTVVFTPLMLECHVQSKQSTHEMPSLSPVQGSSQSTYNSSISEKRVKALCIRAGTKQAFCKRKV